MSILGCALMADWQAISFDKCTYFSPYHNPSLPTPTIHKSVIHATRRQKISDNANVSSSTFHEKISCSIISEQNSCRRALNECRLIQYSPGIEFNVYNYPCESIDNDKCIKTYACQLNQDQSFCLYVNETTHNEVTTQSFAASAQNLLTEHAYKDMIKQCTQADVGGDRCYWIPDSPITKHYCSDCPPICRGFSKSLNFVQFCIGAALLMLSIPIAWVPVASMASERTTKEMQVPRQDYTVELWCQPFCHL